MSSKYFNIANDLEQKIPTLIEKKCSKLPSESMLCREYNVSRQTIRSALELLIREDYITSVPGSGYLLTGRLPASKNRIFLILSASDQYIYPILISSISSELLRRGFNFEYAITDNQYHIEKTILEELLSNPPRLLIVEGICTGLPCPNIQMYRSLADIGCPVLFINSPYDRDFFNITTDYRYEGMHAVDYLHKLGHEKIAGIFPGFSLSGLNMYEGWLNSLWNFSSQSDPICGFYGYNDLERLRKKQDFSYFSRWIDLSIKDATAIVCFNDEIAYWIIKALSSLGLSCPEDISVTGADGSYLSELSSPIISSFKISHTDYVLKLCDYIRAILAGKAEKEYIIKRSFQDCPSISRITPLSL